MFMALFANANRDSKKAAFKFDDFFPFGEVKKKSDYDKLPKAKITDLLYIFKDPGMVKNAPKF